MNAAILFLPFVAPLCLWVAWSDMRDMRIANRTVALLALVYVVIGPFVLPFEEYLWRYANFAVILGVGFVLNAGGLAGGGDAKFAAAAAPFVAAQDAGNVLFIFAAMLLAAFVTHRIAARIGPIRRATAHWKSWTMAKDFPMGLALAGTLLAYLALAGGLV